jgi:DNA-binding SARP family transcriptional activator
MTASVGDRRGTLALTRRRTGAVRLHLLNGFLLTVDGSPVSLPVSVQRLVAFLAVQDRPLRRGFVAASLWMDSDETRAMACLRSALWRLRQPGCPMVEPRGSDLGLGPWVRVDLREALDLARRVLVLSGEEVLPGLGNAQLGLFVHDLLPDWYDEWATLERERFRQIRLHSLERMCELLSGAGLHGAAVLAGVLAVEGEPLRESAHRTLMRAYAAEGNTAEALRQYRCYRRLFRAELGVEPSVHMKALIRSLRG